MSAPIASAPLAAPARVALRALIVRPARSHAHAGANAQAFDLYSLAAFARGRAESIGGAQVPGAAEPLEPGDVLVSRSSLELRRAWVVAAHCGRTAVSSGEWLVLRSSVHEPGYLRQLVVSNEFHLRFVRSLAGARHASPSSTRLGAIELPAPPRPQQRAIARVLDLADALRARRRRALVALDELSFVLRAQCAPAPLDSLERLRSTMNASRRQLEALLSVLRDRAFRGEIVF